MSFSISVISKDPSVLGEGPVWDEINQRITWIDIVGKQIHFFETRTQTHSSISTDDMIGCFAFDQHGDIVAALENGIWRVQEGGKKSVQISTVEKNQKENRFNDGKCDAAGRFWFGSMSLNEIDASGSLYSIDVNGVVEKKFGGVTISNGLCWSLDNRFFYFIDTPLLSVDQFRFDVETGKISERTTAINFPIEEGYPDGMTIDSEGMLWIAHWGGWQITRWDPTSGEKLDSIALPASQITSLCFGGAHMDEIYVTSARRGLTQDQLVEEPLAGHTFCIKNSGFKGLPFHRFGSK